MPDSFTRSHYRRPMPIIAYFLSTTDHPIDEDHPLWNRPLPDHRLSADEKTESVDTQAVTYGRYFSAIASFCATAGWDRVVRAVSRKLERPVVENDLLHVSVFLEKHGAFYHPARLHVAVRDQTLSFVVNVAASTPGRNAMSREVKALERLTVQRPFGWYPQVYDYAPDELPMFLGDWFEGFHEFHLTRRSDGKALAILVWDGASAPCLLSKKQAAGLYRNAAMIMTACFDPITACQIFPWHHASGDFVIRVEEEGVQVRLITVRDYVPMSGSVSEWDNERALLDALVLFFIHLSVRMRLDRLDGVKAIVWAPDGCLKPMIDGFFQGLDLTARLSGLPEAFPDLFGRYFNHHRQSNLLAMARLLTASVFDPHGEACRVIDNHLGDHIHSIYRIMADR